MAWRYGQVNLSAQASRWKRPSCRAAAKSFSSSRAKCFSIMTPLSRDASCAAFTTETYHVAHGKWETNAPIRTAMSYEENGNRYLIGAFLCTPIV